MKMEKKYCVDNGVYPYNPVKQSFCKAASCDKELCLLENNPLYINNYPFSNYKNKGYIACVKGDYSKLYVYNACFCKEDIIELKIPIKYQKEIVALIYVDCKIYIIQKNMIFSVTTDGYFIKEEINENALKKIGCYKKVVNKNKNNPCCKEIGSAMMINICGGVYSCGNIIIVYEKENSFYSCNLTTNGNLVNCVYISDEIKIDFVYDTNCYLYFIGENNVSKRYVYPFCKDCDCCFNGCVGDSKYKVINSIDCIECKLADVLECENKKLKKGIELARCVDELICLNKSVSKTISNIACLESCLKDKLEIILDDKKTD